MKPITIDAGHFGPRYNPGAAAGYFESERMWVLHLKLKTALEKRGIPVRQTRSDRDKDLALEARGRAAAGSACLISLHSNAASSPKADYPVVIHFVDDDCGPIDEESEALAAALAPVVAQTMGTHDKGRTWWRSSAHDRDGDGHKDDYYGILRGSHTVGVPAVILECSFHTNPAMAAWLMEDANLDKLAEAIADALARFYGVTADTAPAEGYTVTLPTLRKGDQGTAVRALQALLIGYGYDCGRAGVDGIWGSATDSALRKYKSRHSLTANGIVDAEDWAELLGV